jgi:hypothetical protein
MRNLLTAVALLLILLSAACSKATPATSGSQGPPPEGAGSEESAEIEYEDFDPTNFDHPTDINNIWLSLKPGTYWAYEGTAVEDGGTLSRRIEYAITDLTKEIGGVQTVVAWIVDYNNHQVIEKEVAFYAQDNEGNVWYLGEHPEEYEEGEFVDAPTWIHGIGGSVAGIMMKADPQRGTPSYSEGWAPAVEFTDRAQVSEMGLQVCAFLDCYEDSLEIAEYNPDEPGIFQLKYYAVGLGEVRVGWKGPDPSQESLELVEYTQLSPVALEQVRAAALELEQHAYEISKDVYAQTLPMQVP